MKEVMSSCQKDKLINAMAKEMKSIEVNEM